MLLECKQCRRWLPGSLLLLLPDNISRHLIQLTELLRAKFVGIYEVCDGTIFLLKKHWLGSDLILFSHMTFLGYFLAEIFKSNPTFPSPVLSQLIVLFCSEFLFLELNMWKTGFKKNGVKMPQFWKTLVSHKFLFLAWQFKGISKQKLLNLTPHLLQVLSRLHFQSIGPLGRCFL